jgi:hypothetical protein
MRVTKSQRHADPLTCLSGEASLCLQGWERVALSLTAESSAKPEASNARPTLPPGSSVPMNARPAFVPANARNRASSASRPGQKAIFCSDSPPKLPGNFPSLAITATDPVSLRTSSHPMHRRLCNRSPRIIPFTGFWPKTTADRASTPDLPSPLAPPTPAIPCHSQTSPRAPSRPIAFLTKTDWSGTSSSAHSPCISCLRRSYFRFATS